MKKSQVLLTSWLALSVPALAQTGAGAGISNASPTTTSPTTAVPSTAAPATNTNMATPVISDPTSGALRVQPTPRQGVTAPQTVQPGMNTQSNQLPTTNPSPRLQDPTAKPCPPTVSSGGADRPRVAGNLAVGGNANCIPTQN